MPPSRSRGEGPVTLSVLDRLVDLDPKRSEELPLTRSQSLREFKANVRRDLEWLFNSREPVADAPNGQYLPNSLYMYGLPDISSISMSNVRDRHRLSRAIEEAIIRFEPRIANPRVTLASTGDEKVQNLHFIIEGMLRIDPSPEPVSFDTVLELTSGEYKVPGDNSAR